MRIVAVVVLVALAGGCTPPGTAPANPPPSPLVEIPDQMRLSHHGEPGWTRSDDPQAPGVFQPCPDQPDPTLVGRVDALTAVGPLTPVGAAATATLHEQLLLFATDDAASTAMIALVKAKDGCGWADVMVDWVPGFDSDVMVTSRWLDPPGTPPHLTTAREEATVLHRGPALWLEFREDRGAFAADVEAAPVDVRAELCQVMGLCYRAN